MKLARAFVLFSFGLFTIAAQSLLFREFITTFEGNDISVGIFFGSWFLWVGVAAALVSKSRFIADRMTENVEFLFLCYLPAFALQFILIVQARELAGLESYALWSFRDILLTSFVVNAPVSIVTGLLFPTACRWVQSESAVSQVYVIEAVGSLSGGLGVTLLLWLGAEPASIFLILAAIVSASVFTVRLASLLTEPRAGRKTACALSLLLPTVFVFLLVSGVNKTFSGCLQVAKWKKLLPEDAPAGSFRTSQAEYLYGSYRGQWVALREGSTCEALPDKAAAGQIAATSLCQNPTAESVLVVGSGLGLCSQFLQIPQIKNVTWAHTDPEYARTIDTFIPAELRISDSRFDRLSGDVRAMLAENLQSYDIVVVNLPDATSSVLNRYYTVEFYDQIRRSLKSDGILAVRVTAGENIMGTELINLGASIRLTLKEVFARFVLTPGEQTWFFASDCEDLTSDPATLRDRFQSIEGSETVFPPEGLLSVYLPDRAAAALESYSHADLPEDLLINRDSRPLTHLYSLLLAAKRSGTPLTRLAKLLTLAGPSVFLIPLLILVVLRLVYILCAEPGTGKSGFDSSLLAFSGGAVGIGTVIVLMYLYQTYFGSLYLHIGIISSVFMVGLTITAAATGALLNRTGTEQNVRRYLPEALLLVAVVIHALILAAITFVPPELWGRAGTAAPWESGHLSFAAAFLWSGFCAGCYFPIAARRLTDCGLETGQIGSKLETADHLGAAAGGVATSLVLVPVLGTRAALLVFIVVMLANMPPALLALLKPHRLSFAETSGLIFRRLGYVLFGLAATVIVCSNVLAWAGGRLVPSLTRQTSQALVGELSLQQVSTVPESLGRQVHYFNVHRADPNDTELAGYVFSSADFAPAVRGFGGKINLAIYVDTAFNLVDFNVVRSNETPSYLKLLDDWQEGLKARSLLKRQPISEIDTVSGATVTSQAILLALGDSASKFARDILDFSAGANFQNARPAGKYLPDARAAYLVGAAVLALIVIYFGGFWTRLIVLATTCIAGGFVLNAQYSTEQIATVLSMNTPAAGLSGAFLLAVGIPVLVAVFGNIYCGYICPFGAAQELLSYVIPLRFKRPLSIEKMQKARFLKYAILMVLMAAFFVSRDRTTLSADTLTDVFSIQLPISDIQWQSLSSLILATIMVGSVLYTRFWCRYLCPAGAFLSLFNKVAILRRLLPAKKFGRCEFGLTAKDQLDCIYCDRCRYQLAPPTRSARLAHTDNMKLGLLSRGLVLSALAVAILVSAVSIDRLVEVLPTSEDYPVSSIASGGQPRDVDLQRVEDLIRQKRLSDREAEFYRKLD
ncbi:MAG: 4Fe-4S binding protein [Phycisphaerae bacterium]|nr:4Fe-4S binding protein [Phycisphaerae bacterium]